MNMNMPNRRAVVAGLSASAAVVAGFLRLKGEDDVDARRRRDRGRGRADVQGPCGENPEINKCSRNRDCCTEFCDREIKRCRYKALGETCTSDQQCRGSRRCIADVRTLPPTATPSGPTATPTATPTETPLPTATPTATPEVPRTWSNLTTVSTMVSGTNYGGRGLHLSNDGLTMYLTSVDLQGLTIWTRASTSTNTWAYSQTLVQQFFNDPWGVTLSPDQLTLFVVSRYNNRVNTFMRSTTADSWGQLGGTIQAYDANAFYHPSHVSISPNGLEAYVSDTRNDRINVWSRPSTTSYSWSHLVNFGSSSDFSWPTGGHLSSDGLTFFAPSYYGGTVTVWNRPDASSTSWTLTTQFGSSGTETGQLRAPVFALPSTDGLTVYINDSANYRIAVWTRPTTSSISWTNTVNFGDRSATANGFSNPFDLGMSNGNLYIEDPSNEWVSVWQDT
ncbi:MAG: hypothetical protein ACKOCK_03220 [Chloroflexota bacterium]